LSQAQRVRAAGVRREEKGIAMKWVKIIALVLIALMSGAAGLAKVMKTPQEVAFFEAAGMSLSFLIPLGIAQILGALLAVNSKTRRAGLGLVALCFLISAIMIFLSGNIGFGVGSLIPVIIAAVLSRVNWGKI